MILQRVDVTNFLSYESAGLELDRSGLTFLVGANNSGKSALLASLDVVAERETRRPWTRIGCDDPARVDALFGVEDPGERLAIVGGEAHDTWLNDEGLATIAIVWRHGYTDLMELASVTLTTASGLRREILRAYRTHPNGAHERQYLSQNMFKSSTDASSVAWGTAQGGAQRLTARNELLNAFPGLGERVVAWQDLAYHFAPVRTGVLSRSPLGNIVRDLEPNGQNLAQALLYQLTRDSTEWSRIKEITDEVLPDAGELLARADGDQIEIVFRDRASGTTLNIKDLGAGVEQALMSIYVGVTQPIGSVIAMEEPEAGLHPGAQRLLLGRLHEWSRTRQFVVSTHSTVFLDEADSTDATVGIVRRVAGVSSLYPSVASAAEPLELLGVKLSDVAIAERILLLEGASDAEVLRAWFPEALMRQNVAIVGLGGGDRAWQTDAIVDVLSGSEALARRVLFIRDRDELTPQHLAQLEENEHVWLLRCRELENYLLDAPAIARVLRETYPYESDQITPGRIEAMFRPLADSLRVTVQIKMTAARIPTYRLADRGAIDEMVTEGADVNRVVEILQARVPVSEEMGRQVQEAWSEVEAILESQWETDKLVLAPGEEILGGVWRQVGGRFKKTRDAGRVASAMTEPPDEFREILDNFADLNGNQR